MSEPRRHVAHLRVRYSETDQMGTFYNSRALEWFEVGRTEWLRSAGLPYTEIESRGVMLPLVEAHLAFQGRAVYDDELTVAVTAEMAGRVRCRFNVEITQTDGSPVTKGWTLHGIIDPAGKPLRPPAWMTELFEQR